MKKIVTSTLFFCMWVIGSQGQTKVFREVSEEISSQIRIIRQDNTLVGYVVFTQLEKADADSFNYKITIMDENLNDIGTINFREIKLFLQSVSFEQDVLCLAYVKTNILGNEYRNLREFRGAAPKGKNAVFLQFLGLDGKIIKSQSLPVDIKVTDYYGSYSSKVLAGGKLAQPIQLHNVSGRGFACFYGDDNKNNLRVYDARGNQYWHKTVKEDGAQAFGLLTSNDNIYLLVKKTDKLVEGGYELLGYKASDSVTFPKYVLKDKQGNSLKVITFANDPVTGQPYLSGNIINPAKGNKYQLGRHVAQGAYSGLFTINLNGVKKSDFKELYSYWNDGSSSFMSKKGYCAEVKGFPRFAESFKDFEGNTYYIGSSVDKKVKVGSIIASILTLPILVPPFLLSSQGYQKVRMTEAVLVKQNIKGMLTLEKSIATNYTGYKPAAYPVSTLNNRSFYNVTNPDTKTGYLIVDDAKDIYIYNINQKKIVRTIPHKDGNVSTFVFPAKEGHVMVSEYNKKERYTRFSIEAL
jgi:hypothetical protein